MKLKLCLFFIMVLLVGTFFVSSYQTGYTTSRDYYSSSYSGYPSNTGNSFSPTLNPGFSGGSYSSYSGINSWQYYQPSFENLYSFGDIDASTIWPILDRVDRDQCEARTDFIIGIPPGGCSPSVVRSDLLAQQNVPVFCQLYAVKVNPLIDVSSIKTISFKGGYPEGVSGISYHPARAAVKSYRTLVGDPTLENIGYVVIILKRERIEDNLEEWVAGNLTATIRYDAEEAYGTGRSQHFLSLNNEDSSIIDNSESSFWNGQGKVELLGIGSTGARIALYKADDKISEFTINPGETSNTIYFPGYYCSVGLKVRLNSYVGPEDSALLNVDGERLWVRRGSQIFNGQCYVGRIDFSSEDSDSGSVGIRCPSGSFNLEIKKRSSENEIILEDSSDSEFDSYFSEANKSVRELVMDYPNVLKENNQISYAEESLYGLIVLAGEKKKFASQLGLVDLFLEEYPNSPLVEEVRLTKSRLLNFDYSDSVQDVYVSNKFRTVSLVALRNEDEGGANVALRINGNLRNNLNIGDEESLRNSNNEKIRIGRIYPGLVEVYHLNSAGAVIGSVNLNLREPILIGGVEVSLEDSDVEEVAYVEILPELKRTSTEANFTFRIGIEKRAIQLSPEKTQEMISNLNESIEKWENANERLGKLLEGWKGACFATSSVLMLKTMVNGLDGESLARQKVMDKYRTICDSERGEQKREECYLEKSEEIDRAVREMKEAINRVNQRMEDAQEDNVREEGLFGSSIANHSLYIQDLKNSLGRNWRYNVQISSGENIQVSVDDLYTVEQIQAAMLYEELKTQGKGPGDPSYDAAKEDLDRSLRNVALLSLENRRSEEASGFFGIPSRDVATLTTIDTINIRWTGKYGRDISGVPSTYAQKRVQAITASGGSAPENSYLIVLDDSGSQGVSGVNKILIKNGGSWVESGPDIRIPTELDSNRLKFYTSGSSGECSFPFRSGSAELSFYESGQNKGLPAVVPFDLRNGWYVRVPNSGGSVLESSPAGYSAAAEPRYFHICNVGENGLMESVDRDLCQSFDVSTAGLVDRFAPCPGLDSRKVNELYLQAQRAIKEASQQYGQSGDYRINGQRISKGKPASESNGLECSDFMSPEDCNTMFNVCDPVICPTSRCDLGGRLPVTNVVGSGIIGSVALCLPNFPEVKVPVCLTGVHAGIDSFTQILKAQRQCLQTNLETGESVGICDEIASIYKCEFFWNELTPLMNLVVPNTIGSLYGEGFGSVRGGGEYTNVAGAWDNLQNSVDFFQNNYATTATQAFRLKNTEEIGGEFCSSFVGTSLPTSAEGIKSLLEPESPFQFYAQFDSSPFTGATTPPTSQYSVYYYIYAGNDVGANYRVYLKSPPVSSYYSSRAQQPIAAGYIPRGSFVDKREVFTFPEGYSELCIDINGIEECGFKKVSSSFAVNYIQDKYVAEQANSEVTTENECVSGKPSALSLANLNLGSGLGEIVNPNIALRGIVRVCASENPGTGVVAENEVACFDDSVCSRGYSCSSTDGSTRGYCIDSSNNREIRNSRWVDVGYCGDPSFRCWMDINTVKDSLERVEAIEGVTTSVLDSQRNLIEEYGSTLQEVRATLERLEQRIDEFDTSSFTEEEVDLINRELNTIIGTEDNHGAGTDVDRANALALKADLYAKIVRDRYSVPEIPRPAPRTGSISTTSSTGLVIRGVDSSRDIDSQTLSKIMKDSSSCNCGNNCDRYADNIIRYSRQEGVDPLLSLAIMIKESNCVFEKVSESNPPAYGLMQIQAESYDQYCKEKLGRENFRNIENKQDKTFQNIGCGIIILKGKYDQYGNGLSENYFRTTEQKVCKDDNFIPKYARYLGWDAAVRGYNGWGCVDSPDKADVDFVEQVGNIFNSLVSSSSSGSSVSSSSTLLFTPLSGDIISVEDTSCNGGSDLVGAVITGKVIGNQCLREGIIYLEESESSSEIYEVRMNRDEFDSFLSFKDRDDNSFGDVLLFVIDLDGLTIDGVNEFSEEIFDIYGIDKFEFLDSFLDYKGLGQDRILVSFSSANIRGDRDIIVHEDFLPSMRKIDKYAEENNVKLFVTSSFRRSSSVSGTVVSPAEKSNHMVGHAIDFNIDYSGGRANYNYLRKSNEENWDKDVAGFIKDVKDDPVLRWGGDLVPEDPIHIDDEYNSDLEVWEQKFVIVQKDNVYESVSV